MTISPVRAPATVGLKVTIRKQLLMAGTTEPHPFVMLKSPVAARFWRSMDVFPVFITVMNWVGLAALMRVEGNKRELRSRLKAGCTPVPLTEMVRGLSNASSWIVSVPPTVPLILGVKVKLNWHVLSG